MAAGDQDSHTTVGLVEDEPSRGMAMLIAKHEKEMRNDQDVLTLAEYRKINGTAALENHALRIVNYNEQSGLYTFGVTDDARTFPLRIADDLAATLNPAMAESITRTPHAAAAPADGHTTLSYSEARFYGEAQQAGSMRLSVTPAGEGLWTVRRAEPSGVFLGSEIMHINPNELEYLNSLGVVRDKPRASNEVVPQTAEGKQLAVLASNAPLAAVTGGIQHDPAHEPTGNRVAANGQTRGGATLLC